MYVLSHVQRGCSGRICTKFNTTAQFVRFAEEFANPNTSLRVHDSTQDASYAFRRHSFASFAFSVKLYRQV